MCVCVWAKNSLMHLAHYFVSLNKLKLLLSGILENQMLPLPREAEASQSLKLLSKSMHEKICKLREGSLIATTFSNIDFGFAICLN